MTTPGETRGNQRLTELWAASSVNPDFDGSRQMARYRASLEAEVRELYSQIAYRDVQIALQLSVLVEAYRVVKAAIAKAKKEEPQV